MKIEVAAHAAFETGLTVFESWVKETLERGGEGYTCDKFLELVDGFAEPLMTHFEWEIATLLSLRE